MRSREDAVAALTEQPHDVLVIGGGITGAGVALDAASRGYSVALVEQADFASGTSSRSSKLVHGGLRYLQSFDLGLVREALLERRLMVRLAPHLVRPLPFVVAAFDGARPDRLTGIGLNMYDVMAASSLRGRRSARRTAAESGDADWSPARHRLISGDEVAELLPAIAARSPTGGYLFYDCQTDDARLVLTVLAEAERFGAICANRLQVTELRRGDDGATTATVSDRLDGGSFAIAARNVVNATGVWADRLRPEELRSEAEVPRIAPSRGTHVIVRDEDLPLRAGAIVPVGDGRSIFALPWLGRTLVGTTDNNYDGDVVHVQPSPTDVAYLLAAVNAFFGAELRESQVTGAYAGVRPLISSRDSRKSVDISRKAELYETSSGLITITGGKLTTWRRMAKLAVDRIVERDGREAPCRTHEIPLGAPVDAAYAIQAVTGALACIAVAWVWFRDRPAGIKNAVLLLGTCMATPYLQDYDLVFGALVVAWLWQYPVTEKTETALQISGGLLLALPLLAAALAHMTGLALGPLFVLPAFAVALDMSRKAQPAALSAVTVQQPS